MSDNEIQELLDNDSGKVLPGAEEYRELFNQLNNASEGTSLKPGFAHRVTARIEAEKSGDPVKKWTILLIGVLLLVTGSVLIYLTGLSVDLTFPRTSGFNLYFAFILLTAVYIGNQLLIFRKRKGEIPNQ